jgi:P-type Mg2+ transporter
VIRDGKQKEISIEEIMPGDIVILNAGDIIPGDCLLIEGKDVFVDEAMLTGETFPVEKEISVLPADAALAERTNSLWMGTHIVSGNAKAIVVHTGKKTGFPKLRSLKRHS